MTSIIYLGAEVPSNRLILESMGSKNVGISFWRLTQRGLPKTKTYEIKNYFPGYMSVFVHSGIPANLKITPEELENFAASYEDFIAVNLSSISSFTECEHDLLPTGFVQEQRRLVWDTVPGNKFRPVWDIKTGLNGLKELSEQYLDIGIRGSDIEAETRLASYTTQLKNSSGTRFHAIACGKPDNLRQVKFETASTMSWLSPMMHGETIVWDGTKIARYPKGMKDQARMRYRHIYEQAGLDPDSILEDDAKEVSKLAIWSFDQLEKRLNMGGQSFDNGDYDEIYDKSQGWLTGENTENTPAVPDKRGVQVRNFEPRDPGEIRTLPVLGFDKKEVIEKDVDGKEVVRDVVVTTSAADSIRACDTCFVAASCPAFKPASVCAFNLPIEVKTKEQLKSLINAILEIQGKRVAFMYFTEELNGGYADPNVSAEIDRLMRLFKTTKDLDDSGSFIKMTAEVRSSDPGVMTRLFGDRAQHLRDSAEPAITEVETTRIIHDALEG